MSATLCDYVEPLYLLSGIENLYLFYALFHINGNSENIDEKETRINNTCNVYYIYIYIAFGRLHLCMAMH